MKKLLTLLLSVMMLISLVVFPTAAETDPLADYMKVVGYQTTVKPTGTSGNDKLYSFRIVAAHTNLDDYWSFGYNVKITYTDSDGVKQEKTLTNPITSNRVYKSLSVSGGDAITAEEFEADYISGVEIKNIPASAGDLTVTVTPFVTTHDQRITGNAVTYTHKLPESITTMTFNIRNWEQKANNHLERLILTIKEANYPDVIGFQEMGTSPDQADWDWCAKIMADTDIAACYAYCGISRGDTTGESCIIFYKKDKFELIETQTRWLYCEHGVTCTNSNCTGKTVAGCFDGTVEGIFKDTASADKPPKVGDTQVYFRILTYVKLKRISDNKEFAFINTHLDTADFNPGSTYTTGQRQNKQMEYILNFAKTLTDAGCPVILTGDFNATTGSTPLTLIATAGFTRAQTAANHTVGAEVPSNSQYTYCGNNTTVPCKDIDHVFVKAPNDCFVRQYTFCDQPITIGTSTAYASDHIPRIAELVIW